VKSKWFSGILILSAGIILGLIGGMILTSQSTRTATDLASLGYRTWEGNQALNAYLNEKPETARYALNHYADILTFFYENKKQDGFPEATAQDLSFTYIRLGKILKSNEAEQFYDRGYDIYTQYRIALGKEVPSREKFIKFVSDLDAKTKPEATSFSDTVTGKSHDISK